ncbi:MAG: O-antigen ligase family protein [Bryobacteraceae bacterium]
MTTQAYPSHPVAPPLLAPRAWRPRKSIYFYFLLFLLAAYAVGGHLTAYIGVRPFYIGEIALFCGLISFAIGLRRNKSRRIFLTPCSVLLILFMILGAIRTFPYVGQYGIAALRDAVVWIYGAFAFIMGGLLLRDETRLGLILVYFRRFSKFYIAIGSFLWVYITFLQFRVPIFLMGRAPRYEEVLIWMGAVTALVFSKVFNYSPVWAVLLCLDVILLFPQNRAGFVAYLSVLLLCWIVNPVSRKFWLLASVGALIVGFMAILDVHITTGRRDLSVSQLTTDVESVFDSQSQSTDEQSTKKWRIEWWTKIVDYTIFGDYFWTGKGFGINLATDDHFQVDPRFQTVRSPHSGHMGILAREGVPGFVLWIALNLLWVFSLSSRLLHAKLRSRKHWSALILVVMSFWLASLVVISFGVELEGPMVGIPFWTNYGIGLAIIYIYHRRPYLLDPPPAQPTWRHAIIPNAATYNTGVQARPA